jgi:hypothetical protein
MGAGRFVVVQAEDLGETVDEVIRAGAVPVMDAENVRRRAAVTLSDPLTGDLSHSDPPLSCIPVWFPDY